DTHSQLDQPKHRQHEAESETLAGLQPAVGEGAHPRAPHEAVGIALEYLIERGGSARNERRADQRVRKRKQRDALWYSQIQTAQCRDEHEQVETGRRKRQELGGSSLLDRARGAL